jgi:uncharacterized membrane protein YtjA (UPF0391 family)
MFLLRWALAFLVIALIAALFGFTGISEGSADLAKLLFFIFLTVVVILVLLGATAYRSVTRT